MDGWFNSLTYDTQVLLCHTVGLQYVEVDQLAQVEGDVIAKADLISLIATWTLMDKGWMFASEGYYYYGITSCGRERLKSLKRIYEKSL